MNIFIFGRKYTGKSTLALYLAQRIQKAKKGYTILIFDPKWTFRSVPHTDDIAEFETMLDDPKATALAFQPGGEEPDSTKPDADNELVMRDFTDFYHAVGMEEMLRHPPERPLILLIDEAMDVRKHPLLSRMIRRATEGKLYLILACHRPAEIEPVLRGKGDEFYFFTQFELRDLEMTEEITGPEVAAATSTLPNHHLIQYKVNGRKAETWNHPEIWFREVGKISEEKEEKQNGIASVVNA